MRRMAARWHPKYWGIPARSAFVSAAVVLVVLTVAGALLTGVLYGSLVSGLDAAAAGRVRDIASGLQSDPPAELDAALVTTDERIAAVQVIDSSGALIRGSATAPHAPLVPAETVGATLRSGLPGHGASPADLRVAAQNVDTPTGRYTLMVGASSAGIESATAAVGVGLMAAAPIVVVGAAVATYLLVRRSLRSVEAIRARVADISASDLTQRVPVPNHRDEISALAMTMNEMLARIESGQLAQRRFVGDASHELRSPLATIISALEVGVAHPELLDEELANTALLPEAHRMRALVEDLLLLARADEHALTLRHADIDLDDLVATEIARLRRDTGQRIECDLTPTRVAGDAGALSRVLRNVLDNAARHAASLIEVTLQPDAGQAQLRIADDGPGIPTGDRLRVFERFVRLDTGRARSGGGTGLGLAIVAEIIAAHRGNVRITDRVGGGTAVIVQLPLAESPAEASTISPPSSR
ncbi:HAMP domain-containing sensor histidine kinase [Mycobacterium sp.]|uniref:sensor histidine kinase n=1 Tax=Mycobacterium sp. TaxID=1785 RepID=UPI002D70F01C|nr:HAMP domain-containing sensor histidine kinase [Mycobacterium sp.]HZA10975.1 HAMP domain-containing sensor histidine kinase [Mycobacterium sp.]